MKRIGFYHSKDMDGFFSGAVLKKAFKDNIELRGWDYKDEVPTFDELVEYDEVILIDVTFPIARLNELAKWTNVTVIDHHIGFKRDFDNYEEDLFFEYIYDDKLSACEIGSKHYFGFISKITELVGEYDTYRAFGTEKWLSSVMPMKYYLYSKVNGPDDVRESWLDSVVENTRALSTFMDHGKTIMNYVDNINKQTTTNFAFERMFNNNLKALCYNMPFFNSEVANSIDNIDDYDILIGFVYDGEQWRVSLRANREDIDCSILAKQKGGGGHKGAAGFSVENFEDIFYE